MIAPIVIACCCAATTCLALGSIAYRKRITAAIGVDKLLCFSPVLMAMSLATFAMEHFFAASALASIVPSWLPFHLFLTYLVGIALLAAAISFSIRRYMPWSALLLTVLFSSFVLLIHIPNMVHHWRQRLFWTLIARESLFAAGALVLAVGHRQGGFLQKHAQTLQRSAAAVAAAVLLFFAAQHFLYPAFAPGVPLPKRTPLWVPLIPLWAYGVGLIDLASAYMFLVSSRARMAAALSGSTLLFLTFFLYAPLLALSFRTAQAVEGINYVADTLLAASALLMCGSIAGLPEDILGIGRRHHSSSEG